MKFVLIAAFAGALLPPLATAQKLELKFDALAAKASDKAEVDLDGALLKLAMQHGGLSKKDKAGEFFSGVQEIHVRNYEFEKPGAYTDQDLEPLRKQVNGVPGWTRIVNVKEKDGTAEVFVLAQGDKVGGCLILAAETRELTVVYLTGIMTLAQMKGMVDSSIAYNLAAFTSLTALGDPK